MERKRRAKICIAALAVVAAALSTTARPARAASPTGKLEVRNLRQVSWRGGRYVATATGETVKVLVSPAYASDSGTAQRWVDFFASLIHGSELSLLTAYVAPLDEVQAICGGSDVLGCYGSDRLVTIGEPADGVTPQSVARHEYGHHVANNRLNAPWVAENWGTKRWATYEHVCSRVASSTAYPGDEGMYYTLNPGEAFAETYRVLNETAVDLPLTWQIVDPSFQPDAGALAALREDVLDPWAGPTVQTIHGRFAAGKHAWTRVITTPLDGALRADVSVGSDGLQLLAANRRSILGTGTWTSSGTHSVQDTICGERRFVLRVTRSDGPRQFRLTVTIP